MSSRFVSGGRIDAATGAVVEPTPNATAASALPKQRHLDGSKSADAVLQETPSAPAVTSAAEPAPAVRNARQEEWAVVEKQLEAERQRRTEARLAAQTAGAGGGETSLYDALQANKAAKQAEFEEQHKLKNQFRPLDEDEVDFLDGLEADARAAEARVKAETAADLDAFRAAQGRGHGGRGGGQGQDDDKPDDGTELVGDTAWGLARKRKRRTDRTTHPKMKRKGSAAEKQDSSNKDEKTEKTKKTEKPPPKEATPQARPTTAAKPALGLADYGSDDSEDS
ncbi:hypothetical protein SEPCBS57363_002559 [Sporothrix epigloea]|uniref:FAM192A/Fyv6 N-terminal domain-containing protein n=1 Tax=Sporothrix epigloea TaxID=1892477 RepID=A0ABP0DIA2_9PEZI